MNKCFLLFIITVCVSVNIFANTYTVDNLNDAGAGSLRQAIADANGNPGEDIINVTVTGTLPLVTSLSTITDSVTINGNSQNGFIIDGQTTSGVRPFNINAAGIVVNINQLTVTRGNGSSLGGGIRVDGGATLNLNNVTVTANTATGAGGIYVAGISTLNVVNSKITNNTVTTAGGDGGGMIISSSNLFMTGTTVSGNSVPNTVGVGSTGGGITGVLSTANPSNPSNLRIENSTFSGNISEQGGGVYCSGASNLYMANVTVTGNTTAGNGGGVYVNSGTTVIRNSTIAGNTANGTGAGGGFYSTGTVLPSITVANTIFADNTANTGAEIRTTGTFQTRGTNIIEGATSGAITVASGVNITGVDPQLAALADNGGLVQTKAIPQNSNARNAGDNAEALNTQASPTALTTDARGSGFARINESTVDVGAYESGAVAPVTHKEFDFDGDGKSDISTFRPASGFWYNLQSSNSSFTSAQFGLSTDKIVPADYDGDGKADLAVYRDGNWYISQSSNSTFRAVAFGNATDIPRPADFDGDGKADISVFRPSDGFWYRLNSSNSQFVAVQFGQNGDVPMIGDYDGDGKADVAVFRTSNSNWYWLQSSDSQFKFAFFGFDGDIPLSGDFNGDGKSDLAVFRPSNQYWYYARPTGVPAQNFESFQFGLASDKPVPADYDGDGKTDYAVYRASEGNWYRINSSNNQLSVVTFGTATDKAVPTAFQP